MGSPDSGDQLIEVDRRLAEAEAHADGIWERTAALNEGKVPRTLAKQLEDAQRIILVPFNEGESAKAWASFLQEPTAKKMERFLRLVKAQHPELLRIISLEAFTSIALGRPAPFRLKALPGLPGPNPRVLLTREDMEAMKADLKRGQVWINATDLDHDAYGALWAAVSYQTQRLGRRYKPPGRARGTAAKKRVAVAKMIRRGMTDYVIYGLGCEAGLWEPDRPDGSYEAYAGKRQERNYRRALRLRKLAQSLRAATPNIQPD